MTSKQPDWSARETTALVTRRLDEDRAINGPRSTNHTRRTAWSNIVQAVAAVSDPGVERDADKCTVKWSNVSSRWKVRAIPTHPTHTAHQVKLCRKPVRRLDRTDPAVTELPPDLTHGRVSRGCIFSKSRSAYATTATRLGGWRPSVVKAPPSRTPRVRV